MPPIPEARFDVTDDDVIALNVRVMRHSSLFQEAFKRVRTASLSVMAVLFIAACIVAWTTATGPADRMLRIGSVLLAFALIAPMYWVRHLTRAAFDRRMVRLTVRLVRQRKVPVTLGPCCVQLGSQELMVTDQAGSAAKRWSAFSQVARKADGVYLELGDGAMVRVPARAFHTESDCTDFIGAARALIAGG